MTKKKKVFMVYAEADESVEFQGVHSSQQRAQGQIDKNPEWLRRRLWMAPRMVTKTELEDIIEDNLTDEQFENGDFR